MIDIKDYNNLRKFNISGRWIQNSLNEEEWLMGETGDGRSRNISVN